VQDREVGVCRRGGTPETVYSYVGRLSDVCAFSVKNLSRILRTSGTPKEALRITAAVLEVLPVKTPGVSEACTLVPDLQFVNPTWDGTAFVPFWGRVLDVSIDPDEEGILPRQIEILRAILTHSHDLRPRFERALFDFYQAEIDGLYCEYGPDARPIPG